jgi:hypothetical protein
MTYTVAINVTLYIAGRARTGLAQVTDTNGYSTCYSGYSIDANGNPQLGGCLDKEDPARRQAAIDYIRYQLKPAGGIQVTRLANGMLEVFDPTNPAHVGGNPTRFSPVYGTVSTAGWVNGSSTSTAAYISAANSFLAASQYA